MMFAGTVSRGATVSATVTTNVRLLLLPAASVAVHVTVVAPRAKVEPSAGAHAAFTAPSTLSTALALNVYGAPAGVTAWSITFPGTVRAGGVVSTTTIVNVLLATFPCESVAVQLIVVVP